MFFDRKEEIVMNECGDESDLFMCVNDVSFMYYSQFSTTLKNWKVLLSNYEYKILPCLT